MNQPVRPHPAGLTYASWHAHLSARTRSSLVFLPRRSPAHPVRPAPQGDRTAHLTPAEWLAHLAGSGQRAA